jgi:hypothetical protein
MNVQRHLIAPLVIMLLVTPHCLAQARPIAAAAKELAETLVKQGGREAAEELAQIGGEAAVRETLEAAAREGGEALVNKTTQYALAHGPLALKAIRPAPARMASALDALPPNLVKPALYAAAREPQVVTRLVGEFGSGALEVAAKHPGVGARLVETFGDDGVRAARTLTTDQAVTLARHADDIAALQPAQRSALLSKIASSPRVVLDYLEKHPRILATAAGVGTVLALKDDIVGTSEIVTGPDGKPVAVAKPGLIERVITTERSPVRTGLNALVVVLVAFLIGWALIRLWGTWRVQRMRVAHEIGKGTKSSDART